MYLFSVTLGFIVRNANGENEKASDAVSILSERNIKQNLKQYNLYDVTLRGIV